MPEALDTEDRQCLPATVHSLPTVVAAAAAAAVVGDPQTLPASVRRLPAAVVVESQRTPLAFASVAAGSLHPMESSPSCAFAHFHRE